MTRAWWLAPGALVIAGITAGLATDTLWPEAPLFKLTYGIAIVGAALGILRWNAIRQEVP